MKKKYHSFDEIKTIFKNYLDPSMSVITDEEYETFCDEIHILPIDIIDTIHTEILFIFMIAKPSKGTPACYLNLEEGLDEEKKGMNVKIDSLLSE